ncbi:UBR1 [Candida theae]|uniref:E3 ubiquitin-protein ligase n=1 Tax=Candida theae TaxID=1198502 RepID=A0AAD5FWR7_9ASCO|nr:UBR1 [Candida theae]KAI5949198.1 UBR1 [Candida theae]
MDEDKLKRFLVELPSALLFQNYSRVKEYVYKALYFSSTDNGKYLSRLFPNLPPIAESDRDQLVYSDFSLQTLDRLPSFQKPDSKEYSHPIGKPCARLFKAGDSVYRCEECGFDDTCVLCSYCFNEQDHLGHSVSVYNSSGNSGGICDCGDPEAFVTTLHCKCSAKRANRSPLKENLLEEPNYECLYSAIKVCLNYVLDVTNSNVSALPIIHEHMNKGLLNFNPRSLSNYFSLPSGKYGGATDANSNVWNLILWNDEFHDLGQAVYAIKLGLSCNDSKATQIATQIDKEGYCVLKGASTYEALKSTKELVERGGLVSTIVSTRDLFRELILRAIIFWLDDILDSRDEIFKSKSQSVLTKLLLDNDYRFAKVFPEEFLRGLTYGTMDECFKNGIPIEDKFVTRFNSNQVRTPVSSLDLRERLIYLLAEPDLELPFSRFQILLIFQIRFPKLVRNKLVSVLLPLLVSNLELKGKFAKQFTEIYPMLLSICAYSDREDHLNLITEISSQLYTCPVTVRKLLQASYGNYIINGLTRIIEESCAVWDEDIGHCIFVDSDTDSQADRRLKRALLRGIHDLEHFSSASLGSDALQAYLRPKNFVFLVSFLKLFHDYLPMTRKRGEHVLQESMTFRLHAAISIPVLSSLRNIAASQVGHPNLDWVVEKLANFLAGEEMYRVEYGQDNIKVSSHAHAFVHPLTSFLSYLIQFAGDNELYSLLQDRKDAVIQLSDASLRSIVLGSQIKIGFWIRNGVSASRQASLYFGPSMSDLTFARDLHLQQIVLLLGNSEEMVRRFLARWELSDWFSNKVDYEDTVYEERFFAIVERFVGFIYKLLTDRSMLSNSSSNETEIAETRKFMAYYLCEKARSYTKLKSKVDSDVSDSAEFDEILYDIADYQPPSALLDTGLYRLKDSVYSQLDPMGLFLDPSKFQILYEVLTKKLSKSKGVKEQEVILTPQISFSGNVAMDNNIGGFLKTNLFVKVLHKLLRVAIDSENESYLPQLLHLIHAILIDDEHIHGKEYLSQSFIDIPICDLLLAIAESNMSKPVVLKADFLVEQLLLKDQRILENLVSCFGVDYVQSFKKRKTQLFESKAEKEKRMSEERKRKIMKKFSKKQEKFLQNNKKLNQEHDEQTEQEEKDARVCVICGEKEKAGQAFGIFLIATEAPLFWKIDNLFDPESRKVWSEDLSAGTDKDNFGQGYNIYSRWTEFQRPVFSSCGHGIHYECFRRGVGNIKYYPCPLCRTYHDSFVPFVAHKPEKGTELHEFVLGDFESKSNEKKLDILRSLFVPPNNGVEYHHYLASKSKYEDIFDHWSANMGSSIQMSEIGTRLNGKAGYSEFLSSIPQNTLNLFKALVQAQVMVFDLGAPWERESWESNRRGLLESSTEADLQSGVFVETLIQFFASGDSLATLARKGMSRILGKIMARVRIDSFDIEAEVSQSNSQTSLSDFEKFAQIWSALGLSTKFERYGRHVFDLAQQIIGVYLRQVIIFQHILLSQCDDAYSIDGEIYSKMAEEIEDQPFIIGVDPLAKVLQNPSLAEILERVLDPETLEYKHFEIARNITHTGSVNQLLALDYPGQVHLCILPEDFQDGLLKLSESNVLRKCMCMFCGQWLNKGHQYGHMKLCSKFGIIYDPARNNLRICIQVGENSLVLEIPGPYVTKHGEPKGDRIKGKAFLNKMKFKELNRLWINQGLYSYVSRPLFGSAPNMMMPNFGFIPGPGARAAADMDIDEDGEIWDMGPDDEDDDEFMFTA